MAKDADEPDPAHAAGDWRALDLTRPVERLWDRLVRPNAAALVIVALLSMLVWGAAGFGHIAMADDWVQLVTYDHQIERTLAHGRWLHAATLAFLGGDLVAPGFTLPAMLVAWWLALLHLARVAGIEAPATRGLMLAAFTFAPVTVAMVGYETNHLAAALSLPLCVVAGTTAWAGATGTLGLARGLGAAVVLYAVGAAGFQQLAVMAPMAFAFCWLAALGRARPQPGARRGIAVVLALAVGGTALYYALAQGVLAVLDVGNDANPYYSSVDGFVDSQLRLHHALRRAGSHILQFLLLPQAAIPWSAKLLALALMIAAAWRVLARRMPHGARLLAAALGAGLVLGPWLLGTVRVGEVYHYTALTPVALIWAAAVALALDGARWRLSQSGLRLAAAMLIALSLQQQNAATVLSATVARGDRALVAAITRAVEALPAFDRVVAGRDGPVPVIIIGRLPGGGMKHHFLGPDRPPMNTMPHGCSVTRCNIHILPHLMTLMQGRDVRYAFLRPDKTREAEKLLAMEVARDMPAWPADGSVAILETGSVLINLGFH